MATSQAYAEVAVTSTLIHQLAWRDCLRNPGRVGSKLSPTKRQHGVKEPYFTDFRATKTHDQRPSSEFLESLKDTVRKGFGGDYYEALRATETVLFGPFRHWIPATYRVVVLLEPFSDSFKRGVLEGWACTSEPRRTTLSVW